MEVKPIEVINVNDVCYPQCFDEYDLSRLLLALLAKSTLPKGESK